MSNPYIRIFILSAIWLTAMQATAVHDKFVFEYLTNNNSLTHNTVYDICQDSKGFMWFATESGLNRYDGQHIKQYHHAPKDSKTLPARVIPSLIYTPDSILFAGTTSGLAAYVPETDDFRQILHDEKSLGSFIGMTQGFDSELLVYTEDAGFFAFDYKQNQITPFKIQDQIFGATTDATGSYWAFSRYVLYRFNKKKEPVARYLVSPDLFASSISYVGKDKQGNLLVGTFENGLFVFNAEEDKFHSLSVCKQTKMYYIRTIEAGENEHEYWVGTENGLYIINTQTDSYVHYTQSFDHKRSTINDNAVYKIFRSKQGIFFVGTYFGGVNIINTRYIGFNAIMPDNKSGVLNGKAISMMTESPQGDLWIATEDAGIAVFSGEHYNFEHLLFSETNPYSISSNNVHALLMDNKTCWAGHFMGGISKIDIASKRATRFLQQPHNPSSLGNNFVFSLHFFSPDSILVGTLSGVDLLNKRTETFSRFRENEFAGSFIYEIFEAPDGKIWFCSYNQGIFILNKHRKELMKRFHANDSSGLTSNSIISYCIDSKKQIWIGTRDGGLLKYIADKQRFEKCPPDMLNDNIIYGIVEDDNGMFWISTNKGLSRLDFRDSTAIHFNVKHGIASNQHNYKSYLKYQDKIYFGSVNGLTRFNPETIFISEEIPSVHFTNLLIFNEIIRPKSKNGLLEKQIDFTERLNLKHNQNSFTIDYASINYFANDIAYEYYLEGFESVWSPPTERLQANYTNLAPGKYIFHIRATNLLNLSVSKERTLIIIIKPAWWVSWYAYLIYFLLLSGIALYFYRSYKNRQQEQMTLAIEKIEKENLKLLHQHKINFFTYISHEFKTPLSIIITSVEMLAQKTSTSENELQETIKRSANRLLSLVNQLMEFRKIETDHAVIHITKGNVVDFSNQIINGYRPLLEKKNIKANIKVSYTQAEIDFDFDKLEKIMTNLLTNAIKYTPQYGTIWFELEVDETRIRFSVKDSGKGISDKKKDKIFEVFYSDYFSNDIVESSGIGLALTASLVKLLKGDISVTGELNKGSQFNVTLPYGPSVTILSEATDQPAIQAYGDTERQYHLTGNLREQHAIPSENKKTETKEQLVIAEDNKDLLALLYKKFKNKYCVKCFENGKDALEYIRHNVPDIVITDIMMPIMSGIELCRRIKTDIDLCHIPVLMLTAKDSEEAKLEGLEVGADAYVSKPFSIKELDVRLNNIFNNQRALKKRMRELSNFEGLNIPSTNQEQAFTEKILAIIQSNIANNELDVQFIAKTLNISRSNLHNKIKKLMNTTVSEFINSVRINKAKELMMREGMTFSEIAFEIGYNDSAYFTRIFKKHTGKTPKEYRQEAKQHDARTNGN